MSELREKFFNPLEAFALKLLPPLEHLTISGDVVIYMLLEQTMLRHIAVGILCERAPKVGAPDEEIELLQTPSDYDRSAPSHLRAPGPHRP